MRICKTCGETLHNLSHPLSSRCDTCHKRMLANKVIDKRSVTVFRGEFSGKPESPSQRDNNIVNRPAFRSYKRLFRDEE